MSIHVALHHRTRYRYTRPIGHAPHIVRLRPAAHCRTRVLAYSLKVEPGEHFLNWQQDPHGNYLARLVFPEKIESLSVTVDLVAEMTVINPFDFFLEPDAENYPFAYSTEASHDLNPYLQASVSGKMFEGLVKEFRPITGRTVDVLVAINNAIRERVAYLIRMEPGVQSPEETLTLGSGSCRDSAWLLVNLLRRLGLAARFVSGYLIQLKADEKPLDGPAGPEADFTDLHAWVEAYLPGAGWVGLDPTSGLLAGEGHLPVACTPEPSGAAPISGAIEPCDSEMEHLMNVARVHEAPRVTLPYSDEQWEAIQRLGHRIDEDLHGMDTRLTMGGEPTFVSMDDMDGAEWNTEAIGPEKRKRSGELIKRLRGRFAPGGLLFHGQGKWYPGEPLPRWAFACYWRKDGEPIWVDESLIADEDKPLHHGMTEAAIFSRALAERLGVDPKWLQPGYEDVFYYLWKERRLPSNVDPLESNLKDPLERARIARVMERGLGEPVGYALPLQRNFLGDDLVWTSGPWFLRDERMYLIPGDSPMGYRLPLDSIPWVEASEYPWVVPADPTFVRPPLPPRGKAAMTGTSAQRMTDFRAWPSDGLASETIQGQQGAGERRRLTPLGPTSDPTKRTPAPWEKQPGHLQSASWIIRTALCVEPREGRLHVFLPPLATTEDFLDLAAAIEDTAAATGLPVWLEGTPPSYDPRLNVIKVTPDPGVLEVNLHPAANWDELVKNTTGLYEEARLCRLGTEKFMLDGRHSGTGGGNHIIIGGPTPVDSPILRRPDLLRSLLTYWNNHPSLSFLFSGLFTGPTSQAPRVDEARHDALRELEVAFAALERDLQPTPWLVDRAFRNLLVDATGNTHRTEFCIDKLYCPVGAQGRLGLLEMRNFEMPPHPRMSLAQHLVLRALVARFWKEPYAQPLVRWGTDIHDRWLLPHFVAEDFGDVLEDLTERGYPMDPAWFAPHVEFRYPRVGDFQHRGIEVELRVAMEPWHVLGEEPTGGGTARHVDSSLERLQVKVRGLTESRHVITCNGRRLPLHPTGKNGEAVAGVRFRAWQPPHCLHPNIGVHSPLTFDLVDLWNTRSLGGCVYHVAHPGGRSHDSFPVNAFEAESRRQARFFRIGHTPGRVYPIVEPAAKEHPFTLDLRTVAEIF
ncbi:MAG: DUF2126 domain-containing protein [Verrucomicrobiales bacterium]